MTFPFPRVPGTCFRTETVPSSCVGKHTRIGKISDIQIPEEKEPRRIVFEEWFVLSKRQRFCFTTGQY